MKKWGWIELGVFVLILAAIVVLVAQHAKKQPSRAAEAVAVKPTPQVIVETHEVEVEVEKLVEVKKEITVEEISSGLQAMGFLETQEFYFHDVISYYSVRTLFNLDIPFTETSYMVGYDGSVTAGIDFAKIKVERDEGRKIIWVTLPPAEFHHVIIDHNSFELLSEKSGVWNPLSVEDVNTSLVELENGAKARALEADLLEKAETNAKLLISSFILQMAGSRYTIRFETAE